jgi:hypothetical protein
VGRVRLGQTQLQAVVVCRRLGRAEGALGWERGDLVDGTLRQRRAQGHGGLGLVRVHLVVVIVVVVTEAVKDRLVKGGRLG